MTYDQLFENIRKRHSFLCVGVATDIRKLPPHLLQEAEDPVFAFNRAIIDATAPHCIAYKLNLMTDLLSHSLPSFPILFIKTILDRDDRILIYK